MQVLSVSGAQCEHVNHVSTQLPYALTVCGVSFVTYIVAGFTQALGIFASGIISWLMGIILLVASLLVLKKKFAAK